jgi:hypothetical protein
MKNERKDRKNNPNPTLTPQQKKENRAISRVRVAIEHLIGDMKSFQILVGCRKSFDRFSGDFRKDDPSKDSDCFRASSYPRKRVSSLFRGLLDSR